ncbi:MAG: hypothetical protein MJK04_03835 [Psychrosphaera sp.]|nr:hypothetical protein [Psychrosphaera sp.]
MATLEIVNVTKKFGSVTVLKGIDIVVGGSIGHMSAFMAQAGRLVVLGDIFDAGGNGVGLCPRMDRSDCFGPLA